MIVAIGMDPGPTPGLVKLTYSEQRLLTVDVVQCTASCFLDILQMWLRGLPKGSACERYFGVERYVRNLRGGGGQAGALTRDMVGSALTLATAGGCHSAQRSAVEVKAWATNLRLTTAGLYEPTQGMPHARDAARHALFTAVADGKIPDPLSRKAQRDG